MKEDLILYRELAFPIEAIGLATGVIRIPNGSDEQPARCYGYPPALIPFWSNPDGMMYTGLWKHWFGTRKPTFVQSYVNVFYRSTEVARTFEQLSCYLLLNEISIFDVKSAEVKQLATELGVKNIELIEDISLETGDDPMALLQLREFLVDAPLNCVPDERTYTGDFPCGTMTLTEESMLGTCSLELGEALEEKIRRQENRPLWYSGINKSQLFSRYMDEGRLSDAWFALNSNGWLFEDIYKALEKLALAHENPSFHAMVSAWCSKEQGRYKVGY
ncbi:hypothetical protein GCM10007907_01650 [Chitinimonas prasina]|uniref:Uncharacterized protein n=1 Tax=Chitinimonas prasina TaxID=1434937 RepID=A0ABQ5Y8W3_9NEIS|nr:hypothetical protein [Chitinimonas prasina]GLR11375.1 hypothetical protein GCM10007907_01650 [Chitinimonas prasina]